MARAKSTEGVHDTKPRTSTVDTDAYPERPYGEAISKSHKEYLDTRLGVKVTPSVRSAADVDA